VANSIKLAHNKAHHSRPASAGTVNANAFIRPCALRYVLGEFMRKILFIITMMVAPSFAMATEFMVLLRIIKIPEGFTLMYSTGTPIITLGKFEGDESDLIVYGKLENLKEHGIAVNGDEEVEKCGLKIQRETNVSEQEMHRTLIRLSDKKLDSFGLFISSSHSFEIFEQVLADLCAHQT
jgi:hypothetical protein